MKIAFIVDQFPRLSETFILNQITGLLDMGHDVELFADINPNETKVQYDVAGYMLMEKVSYFNIPENTITRALKAAGLAVLISCRSPSMMLNSINACRKDFSLRPLYWLARFLGKRFDVIHCQYGPNGIIGSYLKEMGVEGRIVTTFHGYDLSKFISTYGSDVYTNLFLKGDLFIAINNHFKRVLIGLKCDEKKIVVQHLGIDLGKFPYSEKKVNLGETVNILTVGRLTEKKGHEYVIKAIARLIPEYKNIRYIIAGDGVLRNKLESLVSELGLKEYVKFLGSVTQSEVIELYRQAHIFVLHSITASTGDEEGTPVVLMEAQATGLPVVSTYHSGIPEVVIEGESGFLVKEKDVDAIVEKITYLIEHPTELARMGSNGRRLVEENYDLKKLVHRLDEIYRIVVEGS